MGRSRLGTTEHTRKQACRRGEQARFLGDLEELAAGVRSRENNPPTPPRQQITYTTVVLRGSQDAAC